MSYYQYWGKADEPLKASYCSGLDKQQICKDHSEKIASRLGIVKQLVDPHCLDKLASREKWTYQEPNYAAYHLLPYHCLDVAAVAKCWWEASPSLRQQFSQTMQVENEEQAKAWVLFFVALHDLGKLDIRFQMKAEKMAIQLQPDIPQNIKLPVRTDYSHGEAGYAWFLYELETYGFNYSVEDQANKWMTQVAGHHGVIPISRQDKQQISGVSPLLIARDKQARIDWINALQQLFSVDFNAVPENVPPLLAGFCSVCDWIGSSVDYFNYETKPDIALTDYLDSRLGNAKQALQTFGILAQLQEKENKTLETLFPLHAPDGSLYQPRGLQTLTDQLPLVQNLTLIEAPTGSGKTETALVYAARLLHEGLADSIIFALPTQATANAMLERLEKMAENLFVDGATVVLAHGKSKLKDTLEKIVETNKQTAQGQEEATQQAISWLTASKKRAFLGQIGVCTIDQVLLSVLPVKHKFVRSFGIQKSVLIVDEVHAYDSYMYGLLKAVLKQQYQAGGSVLLLSATLPQQQRETLAQSWDDAKIEITKTYPLITQVYADKTSKPFKIEDAQQLPESRTVQLETWALADLQFTDDSLTKIIAAAEQGAKVAVICNLVADAQDLAQRLRELTEIEVDLFHSRFRFIDRHKKENHVKALYGKDSDKRAKGGRILVATQVVEQSLDLDFDWMITHLCPVDLLFQRLGRLHRHERDESERPLNFRIPRCVVIVPEQEAEYGDSQYVYKNKRVLWRTQQLIEQAILKSSPVIFPEAYRDWIEKVYQEEPWQDESAIMTAAYEKYTDEVQFVAKIAANRVMEMPIKPLSDEDDRVTTLTRDGEMSVTVLPVFKQNGKAFTLENEWVNEESKQYWEQISLNSVCVPNSWRTFLPKPEDGVIYLPMQKNEEVWQAELDKEIVFYSVQQGLARNKK
jgi:CRISPR-associated endonuclease/helicase Cas3